MNGSRDGYDREKESMGTQIENWMSYVPVCHFILTRISNICLHSLRRILFDSSCQQSVEFVTSNATKKNPSAPGAQRLGANVMAMTQIRRR